MCIVSCVSYLKRFKTQKQENRDKNQELKKLLATPVRVDDGIRAIVQSRHPLLVLI